MAVKPFNVRDLGDLGKTVLFDPKEMGYRDSLDVIKDESIKIQKSFVKIGWYLKHIQDNELYREDGYANINECAAEQFGYSQSTVSRFIGICEKFSKNHDSPELDEKYSGFDKSQMIEMLPMSQEQLESVTPEMTVKQIREIKEAKVKSKNEPDDGEIRDVCRNCLYDIGERDFENLKEYVSERFGKTNHYYGDSDLSYKCSLRGISINNSDEITWTQFVKRVKELEKTMPGSCFRLKSHVDVAEQADSNILGQTSIEEDFPEYMPDEVSTGLQEETYAMSHEDQAMSDSNEENESTEDSVLDGVYKEIEIFPEKVTQPELPALKNVEQRKEWLKKYKDWGLWYRDDNIDVNYYKFDFKDGSRLIVAEYLQRCSWNGKKDEFYYHLIEKNKHGYDKIYDDAYRQETTSETYLVEFLKNIQKYGNGKPLEFRDEFWKLLSSEGKKKT